MRNIDRTLSFGVKPELIVSDAEFSSAASEVWAHELRLRKIGQVLTLRSDQLEFQEFEGALVRGHEVYCPSGDFTSITAPPRPRPVGTSNDAARDAHRQAMDEFHDARDRQLDFLSDVRKYNDNGSIQVECCARAGKVGCPLVPGSEETAIELGLPIVANPPAPDLRGKICEQTFVTVPVTVTGKLAQRFPFGSKEWEEANNGRASVEGANGSIKSPHTSGLRRGVHEFTGLAWDNLFAGIAAALHNYRSLRNWYETFKPDLHHILISEDEHEWNGWDLHDKRSALASAIGTETGRTFSYEFITHTCDTVADANIVRCHNGPDDDPHGYTQTPSATEVWDGECGKPDCQVVHTYGTVVEMIDQEHRVALELATASNQVSSVEPRSSSAT